MNIQWFPGHMAKTKRMITENIKMVDVVIELLDARIPKSSQNPDITELTRNKPRVIVLNKSDLADPDKNKLWSDWLKKRGIDAIHTNSLTGEGTKELINKLKKIMEQKIQNAKEKGRILRPIKTMVVGIPNVGKSAFINRIAGKATAITGDRPGVTKNKQWIRINREIQLMDTPGVLWPKFDDEETGLNLAFTGAIKDEIMDVATLAVCLLEKLSVLYPEQLKSRFKLTDLDNKTGLEIIEEAGRKRGCLISGGEVDYYRIANIVLDEFRGAKIGRITLEEPVNTDESAK
ncbi:MAG: ribosome biogenesis GTPase YlqF [Clostridiaceae bacterium]|jgi:ribosome biogenesis GTPase A|nr:ribosome biogenesis GTPase YlqF [Clostridiaceae bacterium]